MIFNPNGMMTREHFYGYRPHANPGMPPPLHVTSMCPQANWWPLPRPMPTTGQVGPPLNYGGSGLPCLGVDPTDPLSWGGRGYRQSAGMIGRFNQESDWRGNPQQLNPLGMGE